MVDLDGTLTPTDTLVESLLVLVRTAPRALIGCVLDLRKGRAAFKASIAARVQIDARSLPYNESLLGYLRAQKANGRSIVLATAAHESIAQQVAEHVGLFDRVLASNPTTNLKGTEKLTAIQREVGADFIYAGDSSADLPIWRASGRAIVVGANERLAREVRHEMTVEHEFPAPQPRLADWLRALRVHQWLKNLLLFVPLLTAFTFSDPAHLLASLMAFVAFSLAASGTYIANDLWDLDNDRHHTRKRTRPFAAGLIPIPKGIAAAALLLTLAFAIALGVSSRFALLLLLYVGLTTCYSWILKRYFLIDVIMLALLYTLRIIAGAVAIEIAVSSWLLAFSVFAFFSLALVKRCAELVALENGGGEALKGRDYRTRDLQILWPMGAASAMAAVVVFGLFISAPETLTRYGSPNLLWLAAIGLIYWLGRLWVKTARGEMHDDPLVYAIRDRGSLITIALIVSVFLIAHLPTMSPP